jgi:HAMP domain-containing protein
MVSAFSAIEVLKTLREANAEYKQFLYREAALNPTNPQDRAVAVDAPDFVARSHGEIGSLAESLSRMRRSLVQAMRMLEE